MSLKIFLLGQFKLQVDVLPVELPSRPAQSLLAYLVLNAGVTQRREKLAALLWPEANESNARSYLRQALWRIRKSLEGVALSSEDYLQINDISVTFDSWADYWLDADILTRTTERQTVEQIIEAIQLYRGELLPGFYDEWVILERDRLESTYHQKMNLLMERLIEAGRWQEVLNWGEQWLRLGYSPEPAFRALMLAHGGLGDQGMVTTTYQRCVESLGRELGIEPSPETQQLYESIRQRASQRVSRPVTNISTPAVQKPAFLELDQTLQVEEPTIVAREPQLSQLDNQLNLVLNGQGRVFFITGEAGSGKTALIQEFTRRAQDANTDLVVASGNCNAHTGIGDPYLPFREILELLSGDVEARWEAGAISKEHTHRLWNLSPVTAQALLECGSDLVDTFVPGPALVDRANAYTTAGADWLNHLRAIVERNKTASMIPNPQQSDLFEQYTKVLQTLARQAPLVLVVDDLQWADTGSVGLLFHLGRHLAGNRILVLGAYRSEEVAMGRDGARHPLEPVINEFQRQFGVIEVSLGQADSREFVEAFLDSEPNLLGNPFRQMLFQQTRGQPLFTIELLRGMQERGDVIQNKVGQWMEGPELDWETLPARVEAVIAERIERLPQQLRAALQVASVEGEEFSAEVVARVLGIDERKVVHELSSELDRRHRLVRAQAIARLGEQRISRYRFRHYMFQKYLYEKLDTVERAYLHEDIGNVMEQLYGDQVQETTAIAVQLAWHYQEANIDEKAAYYLHQAGEKAVQLSAYQEGQAHLRRGLAILQNLPESPKRDELELALQLSLGKAVTGMPSLDWKKAYSRARELCQQLGKTSLLCRVLGELSIYDYVRAEYYRARELEYEALELAQQAGDPLMVALSHWYLGFVAFALGEFSTARDHLKQTIAFYDPTKHHDSLVLLRGSDTGTSALSYEACCLWCLGYPDQASKRSQESLDLANKHGHPFSLADVLFYGGCMFNIMRGDILALKEHADRFLRLVTDHSLPSWLSPAKWCQGEALIRSGQVEQGITILRDGMIHHRSIGGNCYLSNPYGALAEGQAQQGLVDDGLLTLEEALRHVEQTGERYWEAELYRVRGELLLMRGDENGAENSFIKAIDIAQNQQARSWELRATTYLARLWQKQGKIETARQILAPVYEWFTEGFDTKDLMAARELLEDLA